MVLEHKTEIRLVKRPLVAPTFEPHIEEAASYECLECHYIVGRNELHSASQCSYLTNYSREQHRLMCPSCKGLGGGGYIQQCGVCKGLGTVYIDPLLSTIYHLCRDCQRHVFVCWSEGYLCDKHHWEGIENQWLHKRVPQCSDYVKEPYYEPNPLAD